MVVLRLGGVVESNMRRVGWWLRGIGDLGFVGRHDGVRRRRVVLWCCVVDGMKGRFEDECDRI